MRKDERFVPLNDEDLKVVLKAGALVGMIGTEKFARAHSLGFPAEGVPANMVEDAYITLMRFASELSVGRYEEFGLKLRVVNEVAQRIKTTAQEFGIDL